jgi:hypothetical protein
MSIWSDAQLTQWSIDAEQDIEKRIPSLIYYRFLLNVVQGISVYTLPSFVRTVSRVTWLGRKLDPVNWDELTYLTPATAVLNDNQPDTVPTVIGRPLYYAKHPTNPYDIRIYPTPNLTLSSNSGLDPYAPYPETQTPQACIIACWRNIDSTFTDPTSLLPSYIDRRTRKAYVLWKAFAAEGKGQNARASKYYEQLYNFLIEQFIKINQSAYIGKRYAIEDGLLTIDGFRYPRPILPSNFERVIY